MFRRGGLNRRWLVALVALASVGLGLCASDSAAVHFDWRGAAQIATAALKGVSCPSVVLCVAVDNAGEVLTTTDPEGGATGWKAADIDGARPLTGISCPSASLCVAVDSAGNVLTSTDPAGGQGAWTITHVDDAINSAAEVSGLTGVSCPLVSLCVAVDGVGDVVTSTAPAGGATGWTVFHADNGIEFECYHYGGSGPSCQPVLVGVSCASGSLCVAVDDAGNVINSTAPGSGSSAWGGASPDVSVPAAYSFNGISCPSLFLCAAVDGYAEEVVTWNPTASPLTRTAASVDENGSGLGGVWCSFPSLCFAFGWDGRLYESTDPSGGATAWSVTYVDAGSGPYGVTGVSCPSLAVCVAVDDAGPVIDGWRVPTSRQIKAALQRQLLPSGHAARRGSLLRRGGYPFSFDAVTSGRVVLGWYLVGQRAHAAAVVATRTLVASGSGRFASPSTVSLVVKLTAKGEQLLRGRMSLDLTAESRFTPMGERPITAVRTFRVTR